MPRKRLLSGAFLPLLGAAALAPSAYSAGSQQINASTALRCGTFSTVRASLSLRGTIDTSTVPGEPLTIRDMAGSFSYDSGLSTPPSVQSHRAYPRLHGFSLSVAGGTTNVMALAGPPRKLADVPVTEGPSATERYEVSIPSLELPAVAAASDGPLVLRFASIAINSAFEGPSGKGDPGDTGAPMQCTPSAAAPTFAIVKSTGDLPGAPALQPMAEPRGPSSDGHLVTLRGTNLTYVKDVQVGTTIVRVGAGVTVKDDRTVEVRMPGQGGGPKDVQVKVVSEFGESGSIPYQYGYAPFPLPTVTGVSPKRVPKSAGTFELVVDGTRLDRARSFRIGTGSGELLSVNQAGTQARVRVRRDATRSFSGSTFSDQLDVSIESDDGCNAYACFSEDTPADDVRLYEPTAEIPGYPQAPTNVKATRSRGPNPLSRDEVTLTWDAAPGSSATGYEIYQGRPSQPRLAVSADTRTATVGLSSPVYTTRFFVRAVDADGNQSAVGDPLIVIGDDDPMVVPKPPQLGAERGTDPTTAVLTFGERFGQRDYEVYLDGVKVRTIYDYDAGGPVYLEGLTPNAEHRIEARAFNVAGVVSALSQPVVIPALTCGDCNDVSIDYAVKGAVTIKTLAKGTAPLSGSLTGGTFVRSSGYFSADLALAPASVRLTAYGFLTVTAKLAIVTSGKVTGTLAGDALKATVKARVKLPSVSFFGIPLAGGTTCQTRSISTIELASTGTFDAKAGGTIGGKFPISDLSGCGVLNGIVSPLTAGANNTISLALSPR